MVVVAIKWPWFRMAATNVLILRYAVLRRRRSKPSPTKAAPTIAREAGSGTAAVVISIVRLALPTPVAVIIYTACSE